MSGNTKSKWFLLVPILIALFVAVNAPATSWSGEPKKTLKEKFDVLLDAEFGELTNLFKEPIDPSMLTRHLGSLITNPDDHSSRFAIGYFYSKIGQYEKSFYHFKKGVRLKQSFIDKVFMLFNEEIKKSPDINYFYDKNLEGVLSSIKDHDVFLTLLTYGLVFNESIKANPDKVISALKKMSSGKSSFSSRYAMHLFIAGMHADNREFGKTVLALEKAVILKQDWVLSHILLGASHALLTHQEEAIASLKKAVQLKPEQFYTHLILGIAQSEFKRHQDAIASFKDAIRINPDYSPTHTILGDTYRKSGQYEDAIASYNEVIRKQPDYAIGHFNLGAAYQKLGKRQKAIARYKEALRLNPALTVARESLNLID
jgi:tetratricopeptide (TPR) repeat protein